MMKWSSLKQALRTDAPTSVNEDAGTDSLALSDNHHGGETATPLDMLDMPSPPSPPTGEADRPDAMEGGPDPAVASQHERARDRSLCKALLGSLYDAVLILDEKGNVIGCNPRAEQFFGHTESELWGLSVTRLISGFNTLVLNKIRAHVANGRFTVLSTNGLKADGGTFAAEIAFGAIHYLHPNDLLLTIRNVDRKKKVERKQSLERDAAAYSGTPLLLIQADGAIIYANETATESCAGHRDEPLTSASIDSILADAAPLRAARDRLKSTEDNQWRGEVVVKRGRTSRTYQAVLKRLPPHRDEPATFVLTLEQA